MFRRLPDLTGTAVNVIVDGKPICARAGDTVAAALLACGVASCRTTAVSGMPRGPYCMMGVCFDCLVTIDGVGNRQGCLVQVSDGMRIDTQVGRRTAKVTCLRTSRISASLPRQFGCSVNARDILWLTASALGIPSSVILQRTK